MPKLKIGPNQKIGSFVTASFLGGGGGGQVWLCKNAAGERCAVKFLNKTGAAPLIRFKDEIATLEANATVPRILPILEKHLPITPTEGDPAWFAMPVAVQLEKELAIQHPALFPFVVHVTPSGLAKSELVEVVRHGLNESVVVLRTAQRSGTQKRLSAEAELDKTILKEAAKGTF